MRQEIRRVNCKLRFDDATKFGTDFGEFVEEFAGASRSLRHVGIVHGEERNRCRISHALAGSSHLLVHKLRSAKLDATVLALVRIGSRPALPGELAGWRSRPDGLPCE